MTRRCVAEQCALRTRLGSVRPRPGAGSIGGTILRSVALTLAFVLAGPAAASAATAQYPNFKTLTPRDLRFDTTDVSQDGSGVIHNVLRFSNTVWNDGPGKLVLRGTIDPVTRSGPAYQRVYDDAGGYADYQIASNFTWHAVHSHYHFADWGNYQLWAKADYDQWLASGRSQGQAKKVGTKTTSCVLDEEFIATLSQTPWPAVYPSSGCYPNSQNVIHEGLSVGWGDTYDYYRFEQWIDLGAGGRLADGQYVMRSVTDPLNKIHESPNKADSSREGQPDNEATTTFSIAGGAIVDSNLPSGTVSINHVASTTTQTAVVVQAIGRDDVSGVDQVRLSNNGTNWATYSYTGANSTPMKINWDLANANYGGSTANGVRTVYAQFRDRAGKWSADIKDTITLDTGPSTSTPYASSVLTDSPVSHWRLNETAGTTAKDEVATNPGSYANAPTLGAAGLLAAESTNTAVAFDGINDQVRIADANSLDMTTRVSLEAWIRPTALPATGAFASVVTKLEAYSIQFNGPRLEFTIMQSGARRRLQATAGAVATGQTYHVVGTYDGAQQRLYLNGVQVASAPLTGNITATMTSLGIGTWNNSEFFSGKIDEVAVYGTALAGARVQAHHDAGSTTTPPPSTTIASPSALTASAVSTSRIDLTWTDNATNETNYVLERATNSTFSGTTIFNLPAGSTRFSDTNVQATTTYYYRVKAINDTTSSGYSGTASATTPSSPLASPAAPTNLFASTTGTRKRPKVALSWTDNALNESAYVVERSPDGTTTNWTKIATLSAGSTSHTDTAVQNGTRYYYRVKATNGAGSSGDSNIVSVVTK
jgi:hypothetical protein